MTEDEVNLKVKEWLQNHSFHYKGILNTRNGKSINSSKNQPSEMESKLQKTNHSYSKLQKTGWGQVPIPDGGRQVLLDHQGIKDNPIDLVWIEAKGSDVNFSELLEGFIRTIYAIYHGGGNGYLAIPHAEYLRLLEQKEFLKAVAESVNGKGTMGLLDVERGTTLEL